MEHTAEPASEGTGADELPNSNPRDTRGFTPEVLDKTVIAVPLLRAMKPWLDRWKIERPKPEEGRDYNPPILDVMIDVSLPTALASAALEPSSRHFSCSSRIAFFSSTVK